MEMKVSMDKKYHTRNGKRVHVLCTDAPGAMPVVGYVDAGGDKITATWYRDGKLGLTYGGEAVSNLGEHPLDLVERRSNVAEIADAVKEELDRLSIYVKDWEALKVACGVANRLYETGKLKVDGE